MDHANLLIGDAEGLSIGQSFDRCHLSKHDKIIVLRVLASLLIKINRI